MFKEKVVITSNDVDKFLNLKVSSIFRYFQQVSTKHSEIINVGTKDTIDKGMAWIIYRMEIVIYEYPKMNDEVVITTHPGEVDKFIYPRLYELYSKKGKLLAAGSSTWLVIDMNTRRIIPRPFGDRVFKGEKCKDDIPLPEKINVGELEKLEDRRVRNSDIDLNGHVNNTKYIDYILDTYEPGYFDSHILKRILVNFDKELKEGEYVELFANKERDIIQGKIDNKTCFTAELEYKER